MTTLLRCRNLSFAYDEHTVLANVDFDVACGEYLCVAGQNGSGKSTLIKGILGLKAPSEGRIEYLEGLKQNEIGYLPQQTAVQKDFPAGALEIVLTGCLNGRGWRPFYCRADAVRANENMERMGVLPLAKRCFRELSGGQQRRVLLARALCAARRLLILDEPVSGLDPHASQELYRAVACLHKENHLTIIMVTHDLKGIQNAGDRVLDLDALSAAYKEGDCRV